MSDKIFNVQHLDLVRRTDLIRSSNRDVRIVLTNGCFDILHRGHVECLEYARSLGDLLVVAVNDDEGIRELKGEGRPVNHLEDRMFMLRHLNCVDEVVPFHGTRATELFRVFRPDVYVKGGDYTIETLNPEERDALMSWTPQPEFRFFKIKTQISTTEILNRSRHFKDSI